MDRPVLQSGLLLLLFVGLSSGCNAPSQSADDSKRQDAISRLSLTPDSQATLPRPLRYRSSSPLEARPRDDGFERTMLEISGTSGRPAPMTQYRRPSSPPHVEVEVIGGGRDTAGVRWGLRVASKASDRSQIQPDPFVDLFGEKMLMRRGDAWRTLSRTSDSLREERFVPLSEKDLHRLARSDSAHLRVNRTLYQLPSQFRRDLQDLYNTSGESQALDTTQVENRMTVFIDPDTDPTMEGGVGTLLRAVRYPETARRSNTQGTVRLGFVIQPDGSASQIQLLRSAHPILDRAAVRGLLQMNFEPGMHEGRAVPVWRWVPVTYELERVSRHGRPTPGRNDDTGQQ